MTVRVSSKFKELILGASSFASIFNGGRVLIYSGAQPLTADYPVQGTLLASITNNGQTWAPNGSAAGLLFVPDGAWYVNDPSQAWQLTGTAAGTAGWFRLQGPLADAGGASYSALRIDGSVGTGGAVDLKLASTTMASGYNLPVQQFLFSLAPAIGA